MPSRKVLYIGLYSKGTTTRQRGEILRSILSDFEFEVIDTTIPFKQTPRIPRSIGFRYKFGPLISNTNKYIVANIAAERYDLIWIDKGVFIQEKTTALLRQKCQKLVYFTPDTSYYKNYSWHFEKSIKHFDCVVYTKSYEDHFYSSRIRPEGRFLTTQGFDKNIHKPYHKFDEKIAAVAFVGLFEKSRGEIVQKLIDAGIYVKLAGKRWNKFINANATNSFLEFLGEGLWAQEYGQLLSSCYFSLGHLSKRFPELHTTRTFEIPACGTALLTESNAETSSFFTSEEAIFYSSNEEAVTKIKHYINNPEALAQLSALGKAAVHRTGRDYHSILNSILGHIKMEG